MTPLLTALAIFVGAILLAGVVAYWVPIITQPASGMATNYLFHISLPKKLPSVKERAAVLAEERYEQQFCLRRLGLPIQRRKMQLESHAVKCAAAELIYSIPAQSYALAEAERMFGAIERSYGELAGMSLEQIYAAMIERLPKARGWVAANQKFLEVYR